MILLTNLTVNPQCLLTLSLLMIDGIIGIVKLDRLVGKSPNISHLPPATKMSSDTTPAIVDKGKWSYNISQNILESDEVYL